MANGGIIGPTNTPSGALASGVWSMAEVLRGSASGNWPRPVFGGNVAYPDIKSMAEVMAHSAVTPPSAGGTLSIDGQSLGSYDFTIKRGNQVVSAFLNADWFTATADSRSAFVIVDGDLTINAGQTLIPSNRKLFTIVYVRGNLTVNGAISMSARGANHSATGSNIAAAAIKIASGNYSGVLNPSVPAAGSLGASSVTSGPGSTGAAASGGGTGGGGSGGDRNGGISGPGAQGSSFSGGPGGGGQDALSGTAGAGSPNGGKGGDAQYAVGFPQGASGGAGNPGGSGAGTSGVAGSDGTGGVLLIFCTGTYSGAGDVLADGVKGGDYAGTAGAAGAGSGGGSITIMSGVDLGPTPLARGGLGGSGSGGFDGGRGGAGTARKLAL